jgi:hypothetical protein
VNPHTSRSANAARASRSRLWRIAVNVWAAILVAVFGIAFFGLTSLVIAWFEDVEGVAGPVTDLGYGILFGVILTTGMLVQLRRSERKIAGVQQAFLVIPALVIGSAIASDWPPRARRTRACDPPARRTERRTTATVDAGGRCVDAEAHGRRQPRQRNRRLSRRKPKAL